MKKSEKKCLRLRQHYELRCALAAMAVALGAAQVCGQCIDEQKLIASDAGGGDIFGASFTMNEDTVVVGARISDDCVVIDDCEGVVYIFQRHGTSWAEVQQLLPSDGGGGFGVSVSVSGNTILVGAWVDACAEGTFCGAAYVFRFDGTSWIQEQKLTASDAGMNDTFGGSVFLRGNTAIVGARHDRCTSDHQCGGSAYVYRFNGSSWVEEQKLIVSDAALGDQFGSSVFVSGNMAVIGASRDDCAGGDNCGSTYVFRFNGTTWIEVQKLTASDVGAGDLFGDSVSVNGDTAVVGAHSDDCTAGDRCGSAYVFRFNGTSWVQEQKLFASDARTRAFFGTSVSVSREMIAVGARGDACTAGDECGSAYIYRYNGTSWVEDQKLTAADADAFSRFGSAVAIFESTLLVGALGDACDGLHSACGAAYVFSCDSPAPLVNLDIKPGSCPNLVNSKSKGGVPVAIVGSFDFDVTMIDLDSLTLARVDGVGEGVTPLASRRGLRVAIEDLASPSGGEPCDCHDAVADGFDDLSLKFSTAEMSRAFELTGLSKGETIELVLRGTLQDGTPFEATDCIVVPGSRRSSSELRRTKRSK